MWYGRVDVEARAMVVLEAAGGYCSGKRMGLGLGFPRTFKGLGLSGSIFGSRLILVVGPLSIGLGLIRFWVLNLGLGL
ncbi:hypothetical protein ES332_A12G168500v1 [Gossypium tomentosum]|uniref:Uncharacterized protein n=1 Tax=Gossypium tomentosum TaxID=34277 RepID=A0A5D2MYU8_GOSTO|nr:hypothetical protein ES332_A12G168500v1 [Gossypium tomentosum]